MVEPRKTSMFDLKSSGVYHQLCTRCIHDSHRFVNLPRLSISLVLLLGAIFAITYHNLFNFFSLGGGGPISISLIALFAFLKKLIY